MFYGETHYFDWAIFNSYRNLPDGTCFGIDPHTHTLSLSGIDHGHLIRRVSSDTERSIYVDIS